MNSKRPLRIVIVGCGRMGNQHAAACQRHGARIVVACDHDQQRAAGLAAKYPGAAVLTNAEKIDWQGLDAAFICTPPFARGAVECAAAESGVALFLEKPVGLSVAVASQIHAAAARGGVLTAVGYMNRYRASVQRAKQLSNDQGTVGLACHWVASVYRVPWWGVRKMSGGQINEQCTHFLDLIRYFCGEIVEVAAAAQPSPSTWQEDIDVASAVLCRAKSGVLATLFASCGANSKQIGLQLFTRERAIHLDGWNLQLRGPEDVLEEPDIFDCETAAFLQAVREHDHSLIRSDLADAMRTQAVADAAVRAVASRNWEVVEQSSEMAAENSFR